MVLIPSKLFPIRSSFNVPPEVVVDDINESWVSALFKQSTKAEFMFITATAVNHGQPKVGSIKPLEQASAFGLRHRELNLDLHRLLFSSLYAACRLKPKPCFASP